MGEIKSTLDLVMEKTKHMTLSEEEKKAQQDEMFKREFTGLLQKYQDKILNAERFGEEWEALKRRFNMASGAAAVKEILTRIRIDGQAPDLMTLLKQVFHVDTGALEGVMKEYAENISGLSASSLADGKIRLKEPFGISGDAAVPNPGKDPALRARMEKMYAVHAEKLDRCKSRLIEEFDK